MEEDRKFWSVPRLAIVVRGPVEEAVLTACKAGTWPGLSGSSNVDFGTCIWNGSGCGTPCNSLGAS